MELALAAICMIAYFKTFDSGCLIATGLLMIGWEIWNKGRR